MPWSKVDGSDVEDCADDEIAVVKDDDGTVEGCHATEEEADEQIAALEASEEKARFSPKEPEVAVLPGGEKIAPTAGSPSESNGQVQHRAMTANVRENDGKETITFEINNDGVDRHGTRLLPGGARLENFKQNPVVLYGHGRGPKGDVPIGRAENIFTRDDKLFAEVRFDQDDDFAQEVERKVRDGFLSAASVGFDPMDDPEKREGPDGEEVPTFTDWELLEFSVVSVPSNPGALVESREEGYIDRLADKVAQRIEDRIVEDDAPSAEGAASDDSETDDADAAREVEDDDSQADGARDALRTKMRLSYAVDADGIDEDELIDSFKRKLGKK